jgi:hypothetical protein
MLVANAYNSSLLRRQSQEDHSSKPVQANSSGNPILKYTQLRKGLAEVYNPSYLSPPKIRRTVV